MKNFLAEKYLKEELLMLVQRGHGPATTLQRNEEEKSYEVHIPEKAEGETMIEKKIDISQYDSV
jgi:hypothetical protein